MPTFCETHKIRYMKHCPSCDSDAIALRDRLSRACDALAVEFFEGSGDIMAVSHSLRNVILARFEWVKKHGKDAGE